MSKIGNYRVGLQEDENYKFGWESAERGEPEPEWLAVTGAQAQRLANQRLGWNDFHYQEQPHAD